MSAVSLLLIVTLITVVIIQCLLIFRKRKSGAVIRDTNQTLWMFLSCLIRHMYCMKSPGQENMKQSIAMPQPCKKHAKSVLSMSSLRNSIAMCICLLNAVMLKYSAHQVYNIRHHCNTYCLLLPSNQNFQLYYRLIGKCGRLRVGQ